MLHFRWAVRQREALQGTCRKQFTEFAPALCIAGDAGVEIAAIDAVLNAKDGFDIAFAALGDPLYSAGGIVDISQGQGRDASAGGPFRQVFR